jgi:hypothetical protein
MTAAVETAAEKATEVVQQAAKPIAFVLTVIGAALAVGYAVRKLGRALPLPDYLQPWDTDPAPETNEDED